MKVFLPLFGLLILNACVSPARKLDLSLVNQIHEGTTTRAEVETLLGPSKSTAAGANQRALVLYEFSQARKHPGWAGASKAEAGVIIFRTLTVLYSSNVVEKFVCEQSNTPVRYEPTGIAAGHQVLDTSISQITKGITSKGELIQWFGPPTMQTLDFQGNRVLCWLYAEKNRRWPSDDHQRDFRAVIDSDNFVQDFCVFGTSGFGIELFR